MSSQESTEKPHHKHRRRPLRLDWPNSKRPRRVTIETNNNENQQQLWIDRYAPKRCDDLAVAPKKIKQVREWLLNNNSKQLLLLVGAPGIGKSTMVHLLAQELQYSVLEWTENCSSTAYDRRSRMDSLTPLQSFVDFMSRSGTGFGSVIVSDADNKTNQSLIVIDELPHLHNDEMKATFRETMNTHVQRTTIKTVWIMSDTVEGKMDPQFLQALIDPALCCIVQMSPPTKPKFGKAIKAIVRRSSSSSSLDVDSLYQECRGDLRFAISNFQFQFSGRTKKLTNKNNKNTDQQQQPRDMRLSSFHALGKLLYAKRDSDGNLLFDPEAVIQNSGMQVSSIQHFVAFHCPEFFTQVEDLADTLAYLSDAAMFVGHDLEAAASLCGRAVATTNRHSSAFSFRHFGAPGIFDVHRRRRESQGRMQRYKNTNSRLGADTVATDLYPFLRVIAPHVLEATAKDHHQSDTVANDPAEEASLKIQNEILKYDDIVDDSDDEF